MGSKKEKSCGKKLMCFLLVLAAICVAVTLTWYFAYFAKDVEIVTGDCGGCYCIPDETTNFECPAKTGTNDAPPANYPEQTHLNVWKSLTILNPYILNCNPYKDGVLCDTEPPLDPDFEWSKLGETAVCAIHYEKEQGERGLESMETQHWRQRRNLEEQQSEVQIDLDDDLGLSENSTESNDGDNTLEFAQENETCENTAFYRIKTYSSREAAESAGGFVTHVGNCGVCSTLQDLAVYANADFMAATSPGNFCRRQASTSFQNGLACFRGLGMTQDCAKLWADTSWNTARNCFGSCVLRSTLPQFGGENDDGNNSTVNSTETTAQESAEEGHSWYDLPAILRERFKKSNATNDESEENKRKAIPGNGPAPECALNDCITCNDEVSAPTFERFAGRSRRRSGLLSTAARPCGSVPAWIIQNPCPITQPLVDRLEIPS